VTCCVVAAVLATVTRRFGQSPANVGVGAGRKPQLGGRLSLGGAAIATLVVLFQWCTYSTERLAGGMVAFDSLWYHMPFAGEFASSGSTVGLHFTQRDPTQTYYPATAELLHAIVIAAFGGWDFLTVFVNLAAAALALLAAWCIGEPRGVGPLSVIGVALVLILPIMLGTQPGEGQNDVIGLAFLLAAVAFLMTADLGATEAVSVGAAVGLAIGTKLSSLVPGFLVLAAAVLLLPAGRRRRLAGLAVGTAVVGGGFWYVRNLATTGNPLPWVGFHLGPIGLTAVPTPQDSQLSFSLAHYLTDTHLVRTQLIPQLHVAVGRLWPALLATAALGGILALADRDRRVRLVGAISIAVGLAYVVTPGSAAGPEGHPSLFGLNFRYATPALALALAVLPATALLLRGRRWMVLYAWLLVLLPVTLAAAGIWPRFSFFEDAGRWWGPALAAGIVAAVALLAWSRAPGRHALLAAGLVSLAAAAVAWPAAKTYEKHRYAQQTGALGVGSAALWARDIAHARIAVSNYLLTYPLYGLRVSNDVDLLGRRGPHGAFRPIDTCRAWRDALTRGHYRYAVVGPGAQYGAGVAGVQGWTGTAPGVRKVVSEPSGTTVYRIDRPLDPAGCPR
jgi:hypothetical protein